VNFCPNGFSFLKEVTYNYLQQERTVSNSTLNFMRMLSSYCGAVYKETWVLNGNGLTVKNACSSSFLPLPPPSPFFSCGNIYVSGAKAKSGRDRLGLRFLDRTQLPRRTPVWVITPSQTNTRDKHLCSLWDSNARSQRLRDCIPTP